MKSVAGSGLLRLFDKHFVSDVDHAPHTGAMLIRDPKLLRCDALGLHRKLNNHLVVAFRPLRAVLNPAALS